MLTIIIALLILSVLILAHELGHFLAAKKAGIKVEEFGIGYPPRLWGKKIGETIYSINALPFGGFVRLFGEELKDSGKGGQEKKKAFWAKSKKARVSVIVAGVVANFLLAVIAFAVVYSKMGIPTKTNQVEVLGVVPGSPAEEFLKEDDLVLALDGEELKGLDHFINLIDKKKGEKIGLRVQRGEEELAFSLTPRQETPEGEGPLGVVVSDVRMIHYPFWQMPFRGVVEGFKEAYGWTLLVLGGLKQMVVDLVSRKGVPEGIAGPIGILQVTAGAAQSGFLTVLQFMGILSVNLAVLNILPFPALDGGRLVFIVYEALTRRRPKPEFERWVNTIGMAFLILLLVLVSINDFNRAWQTTEIASKLRSLWPF